MEERYETRCSWTIIKNVLENFTIKNIMKYSALILTEYDGGGEGGDEKFIQ